MSFNIQIFDTILTSGLTPAFSTTQYWMFAILFVVFLMFSRLLGDNVMGFIFTTSVILVGAIYSIPTWGIVPYVILILAYIIPVALWRLLVR